MGLPQGMVAAAQGAYDWEWEYGINDGDMGAAILAAVAWLRSDEAEAKEIRRRMNSKGRLEWRRIWPEGDPAGIMLAVLEAYNA